MAEKKHSTHALLDILIKYSDEDHILTTKEIQDLLMSIYGLNIERRTLYSNIGILEQAGYKISKYDDNKKGYFLEEKQFTKGEILLLCNAIHASHFISNKESDILITKLLNTLSNHERKEYKDNVYMRNSQKNTNNDLIYNIALASEAIRDKKLISFTYNRYDTNKKMIARRTEPYIVEPRYIVYSDSRPYLIATDRKHFDFTHYRLDRISKAYLLEEKVKHLPKDVDAYGYAKNKLFMYGGEMRNVTFLCKNSIIDAMIDTFGKEVSIMPKDDESFILTVNTNLVGAKILAQQYLNSMEILQPEDLRKEFRKELEKTLKAYKKSY